MAGFFADLRIALRSLRHRPGVSLAVLLTLTLGIGANTALFSVVRGVLLRRLPVVDPERTVMVYQHDRELGIRLALGAPRWRLLREVVGHGVALALLGVGLGLVGALGLTRLLQGLLFGVARTDPVIFAATPVILAGVAVLASCLPARRATRVDPMIALRSE
jgi:hypothetical protein